MPCTKQQFNKYLRMNLHGAWRKKIFQIRKPRALIVPAFSFLESPGDVPWQQIWMADCWRDTEWRTRHEWRSQPDTGSPHSDDLGHRLPWPHSCSGALGRLSPWSSDFQRSLTLEWARTDGHKRQRNGKKRIRLPFFLLCASRKSAQSCLEAGGPSWSPWLCRRLLILWLG